MLLFVYIRTIILVLIRIPILLLMLINANTNINMNINTNVYTNIFRRQPVGNEPKKRRELNNKGTGKKQLHLFQ